MSMALIWVIGACTVSGCAILWALCANAVVGHEDESGFHYGHEPVTLTKDRMVTSFYLEDADVAA